MERERLAADRIVFLKAERIVDKTENEEKQRHQDSILDLSAIPFRNSERSVHIYLDQVPEFAGTKLGIPDFRPKYSRNFPPNQGFVTFLIPSISFPFPAHDSILILRRKEK